MSTRSSFEKSILAGFIAALMLVACQRRREGVEEYAARNAVVRYNQRLVEAFRASRADLMSDVAEPGEVSRSAAIISGLLSKGLCMEARQTSFEVERTSLPRGNDASSFAELYAVESWEYEHRLYDPSCSRPGETKKQASYKLAYRLRKTGTGAWIVADVIDRENPPVRTDFPGSATSGGHDGGSAR